MNEEQVVVIHGVSMTLKEAKEKSLVRYVVSDEVIRGYTLLEPPTVTEL